MVENQYMRSIIAAFVLFLSSGVSGQVPHTFQNGQAADADKVNENFEYVLENASGGCSATQQDSNVLITCADGTSGVIAGAGTILVIPPEGVTGTVPDTYDAGPIVVLDANGVLLGEGNKSNVEEWTVKTDTGNKLLLIEDLNGTSVTPVSGGPLNNRTIFFTGLDCTGLGAIGQASDDITVNEEGYFIVDTASGALGSLLYRSAVSPIYKRSDGVIQGGPCGNGQFVAAGWYAVIEYFPADGILNAVAPLSLDQLP